MTNLIHSAEGLQVGPGCVNQLWNIDEVLGEPRWSRPRIRGKRTVAVRGVMPIRHYGQEGSQDVDWVCCYKVAQLIIG